MNPTAYKPKPSGSGHRGVIKRPLACLDQNAEGMKVYLRMIKSII